MIKFAMLRAPFVAVLYGIVGIIFNPFLMFHFDKAVWKTLDILTCVFLLFSFALEKRPSI